MNKEIATLITSGRFQSRARQPNSCTCIKFHSTTTRCTEVLGRKTECFLFNQHGSHSAFPIIANLCHFHPFDETSKRSLSSHNVRVIFKITEGITRNTHQVVFLKPPVFTKRIRIKIQNMIAAAR